MARVNVDNVVETYGGHLECFIDGVKVGVQWFDPVTGEVNVIPDIGGRGRLDANDEWVSCTFIPVHFKAVIRGTENAVYERNLKNRAVSS